MKPESGPWIGSFVTRDGRGVQIAATLKFEDDYSASGSFTVSGDLKHWKGPTKGTFSEGGYSPFGSLSLEEEENHQELGSARFDGRYENPMNKVSLIWGTVLITKKEKDGSLKHEQGTLALIFAPPPVQDDANGVWGE